MATSEPKTRRCLKCKQERAIEQFQSTPSKFFPGGKCYICTPCLESMIKQDNLGEVDRLMRWLDLPFDLDKWTQLYAQHQDHTLTAYFNLLYDDHYSQLQWADENERWRLAREQGTIDDQIKELGDAKLKQLRVVWSGTYKAEELLWLDNYYNKIMATQNVSTPILQDRARDLCELSLLAKKTLRAGGDVKKIMDSIDNIVKTYHFEASNAKSAADFESVGELMVYYGKKGWHPNWHTEPQDSIDFMMENIQNYLKRLVINEGNFAEQVEDKKARYNMTERLEEIENEKVDFDETADIEYEGDELLAAELGEEGGGTSGAK